MIIRYSKKSLKGELVMGSSYLLMGILGLVIGSGWAIKYGFTTIGVLYLITLYHKRKYNYLQIKDGAIVYYRFWKKREILLNNITRIKKFTDEVTFFTPEKKLKITTRLINKKDLPAFKEVLSRLDLSPQDNPFLKETKTI